MFFLCSWQWWHYPHRLKESVSLVCGIFNILVSGVNVYAGWGLDMYRTRPTGVTDWGDGSIASGQGSHCGNRRINMNNWLWFCADMTSHNFVQKYFPVNILSKKTIIYLCSSWILNLTWFWHRNNFSWVHGSTNKDTYLEIFFIFKNINPCFDFLCLHASHKILR